MGLPAIACVALLLVATPIHAGGLVEVFFEPFPLHVQGERSNVFEREIEPSRSLTALDSLVYSNTHFNYYDPPAWFPPGADVAFADDLHMKDAGRLTEFLFLYHEPEKSVVQVTASFYSNDETDERVGPLLAGPYELGPFASGTYRVRATVKDTVFVGPDVWFSLKFKSPSAGAVLAHPPFVGSSHDLYYNFGLGRMGTFRGAMANIYLQVRVDPSTVGVADVTWSTVKALYRPRWTEPPTKP